MQLGFVIFCVTISSVFFFVDLQTFSVLPFLKTPLEFHAVITLIVSVYCRWVVFDQELLLRL